MKRNWDLIREVLIACEDAPAGATISSDDLAKALPAWSSADLYEHVRMLEREGYLEARVLPTSRGPGHSGVFVILGLPWDGHDLIAQMRSQTWWAKVKSLAAEKGTELTFDVIKALATPALAAVVGVAT